MDADERLTALKKAYADIILNTAKEAAARIMVSERKAVRLEHELYAAKEEAVQMLLRLKQMMDFKVSEAEMTSCSQQRKIEELEAQLQEAEDIVNDLREELRGVQAELERFPNEEIQHLEQNNIAPIEIPEEGTLDFSQHRCFPSELGNEFAAASGMVNLNSNQNNRSQKLYHPLVPMVNSYIANPDLPSIILRSKEPVLYRNGCTQRVRAREGTLLDKELSISGKTNDVKYVSTMEEDKGGERISKASDCELDTMCNMQKKETVQDDSMVESWYQVRAVKSFGNRRKRGTRYRKKRTPRMYQPIQRKKIYQSPDISCLTNPDSVNGMQSNEDPPMMCPAVSSDTNSMGIEHGCTEARACVFQSEINKVEVSREEFLPMTKEKVESPPSSEVPVCEMKVEKIDAPLVNPESKASDTAPKVSIRPGSDRIIKYTFQRKRKRETLGSCDRNALTKNSTLEKMDGVNENGNLEPEKSTLVEESSQDTRRLAQEALEELRFDEDENFSLSSRCRLEFGHFSWTLIGSPLYCCCCWKFDPVAYIVVREKMVAVKLGRPH